MLGQTQCGVLLPNATTVLAITIVILLSHIGAKHSFAQSGPCCNKGVRVVTPRDRLCCLQVSDGSIFIEVDYITLYRGVRVLAPSLAASDA